jgi:hypothetical protein
MIPKLSSTSYAVKSVFHISNTDPLKLINFFIFPFHYEILSHLYIKIIFTLRKRTVRIMAGAKTRNSYRSPFMRLETLPLPCEYIFSLMNFFVNNQEHFQTDSSRNSVNTRN